MACQTFVKVLTAFTLVSNCSAIGSFLELVNTNATEADAEQGLLAELANTARRTPASSRITELQNQLQPLFEAIPKEGNDRVSHTVVIYMLHRFFAKHRGWAIRGLDPTASAQNLSSADTEMRGWMPRYLQQFLEAVVGTSSLNLREIAAFAATLEDFIQKEERQWLDKVYSLLGMHPKKSTVSRAELSPILEVYLMLYNLDGNFTSRGPDDIFRMLMNFPGQMKVWNNTQDFIRKTIDETWQPHHKANFEDVLRTVKVISEHYSRVYDNDCRSMKNELLHIESKKPGRVRLTDFYKLSLNGGVWEFTEKIDYLRSFGALDDSDPATPLVIIPNYLGGRQNCLTASSYYALCCRNECEDLMEALELELAAPMARPSQIIAFVKSLSSSTVAAPRALPTALVERLQRVASVHGGEVPLHGRLFAQWMHHAFPRECPYPHVAGTTTALTPDEWMKETGQENSQATTEEMLEHVRKDSCRLTPTGVACGRPRGLMTKAAQVPTPERTEEDQELPWNEKEELLVVRTPVKIDKPASSNYMKDAVVFMILASMVSALSFSARSFLKLVPQKSEKCII